MPRTYTTRPGDMLDIIAFRHYGGQQLGVVEAILEANAPMILSQYPERLPAGLVITLPDLPDASSRRGAATVKLWD